MMARARRSLRPKRKKEVEPTGLLLVDALAGLPQCSMADYLSAASEYIKLSSTIDPDERRARRKKKAAQIRLSNALGRVLAEQLRERLPELRGAVVGERTVSGALRSTRADVSEIHETDGLRLAVELKPVNLAVGRAIWNRFGDIRTFAVNLHLKFPFCVVGGVLAIPTYEETGTPQAMEALAEEDEVISEGPTVEAIDETGARRQVQPPQQSTRRSTLHLIERAVSRSGSSWWSQDRR
jgi:hypothetical protein